MKIREAVKSVKYQKSPGLDNIPTIIWKDPIFHDLLMKIWNYTSQHLVAPSAWLKSGIIPVPKKGDLTFALNYRGISLTPSCKNI